VNTLIVDGNNLFKIGFHGVRDFYFKGNHIGGLFHFLNTLRKFLDENHYDKVIVFWDGKNNSSRRQKISETYKGNKRSDSRYNDPKMESYDYQMNRVKEYLEEIFVRQVQVDDLESDDMIAYYCRISNNENKTIFSSDKDLTQLIGDNVRVYSPLERVFISKDDKVKIDKIEIPHYNVVTYKIIRGDRSDNVDGIYNLGEKKILNFFPEIAEEKVTIEQILQKTKELYEKNPKNKTLENILTGKSKRGIFGEEFFTKNKKLVDLKTDYLETEEKEVLNEIYNDVIDPEDRGYKNLIRMMKEDGIFKYLPKDDRWTDFITPFLKLTRKEKKKFKEFKNQKL